ncbi:conserved unknown protein [Ectocarpus siliculosus]|uniref:NAD(P)-binding domain-containing protein n=1 Tax=Ectocarpus siliculosus TaxID=2880 RepID=D7G863_ECTSI|nr:conserved unknown protein [Ectocarpus siliculosus]|eukprot:CBJ27926.1 conserved unknown protein [Ectocarpus siliculosus]
MSKYRYLLALLSILGVVHLGKGFKMNPKPPQLPPLKDQQVLVTGAAGNVGQLVCLRLSKQGYKVRAMVRELDGFYPRKEEMGNGPIEVVLGDVLDKASLEAHMAGCSSCIACHGASRASALSDWWTRLKNAEKGHPYNVNYIGTMNMLDAAQRAGVKRFVRLTGLSVGLSAFNPFTYLLNLMISMSIKWQYMSERAIREAAERSGLDYTVVRPGALTHEKRPKDACLMLECDGKPTSMWKSQPMYKIGRQDVANLLVAAMAHKRGAKSTLSCSWGKDKKREGPRSWKKLLAAVNADTSPLPRRFYRPAMIAMGTLNLIVGGAVGGKFLTILG